MERYFVFMDRKIIKMLILPNLIYRFNSNPIKILGSYFVDLDKFILKE